MSNTTSRSRACAGNACKSRQKQHDLLNSLKDQLVRERETLERRIREKKAALASRAMSELSGKGKKPTRSEKVAGASAESTPSKVSAAYSTDVPSFLKRVNVQPAAKRQNQFAARTTMQLAIERYEELLRQGERSRARKAQAVTEQSDEWTRMTDIESAKRKVNTLNTHEYICAQIKENVSRCD